MQRYEPMHHISGNHLRCGDWCRGKKALEMGLQYKRPMLDLKKEQDQKTFEGIKKMHEQFVTEEKLREMMHPYNTQCKVHNALP